MNELCDLWVIEFPALPKDLRGERHQSRNQSPPRWWKADGKATLTYDRRSSGYVLSTGTKRLAGLVSRSFSCSHHSSRVELPRGTIPCKPAGWSRRNQTSRANTQEARRWSVVSSCWFLWCLISTENSTFNWYKQFLCDDTYKYKFVLKNSTFNFEINNFFVIYIQI